MNIENIYFEKNIIFNNKFIYQSIHIRLKDFDKFIIILLRINLYSF